MRRLRDDPVQGLVALACIQDRINVFRRISKQDVNHRSTMELAPLKGNVFCLKLWSQTDLHNLATAQYTAPQECARDALDPMPMRREDQTYIIEASAMPT